MNVRSRGAIDRFYQQQMESEAGNDNVGARLAIYFERKISGVEDALDILGDRALTQVVQNCPGASSAIQPCLNRSAAGNH